METGWVKQQKKKKQVTRTFSQKQLSFYGIYAWNCESPAPANVVQTTKGGLSWPALMFLNEHWTEAAIYQQTVATYQVPEMVLLLSEIQFWLKINK